MQEREAYSHQADDYQPLNTNRLILSIRLSSDWKGDRKDAWEGDF